MPSPTRSTRLLALIRDELGRPTQRRLVEIEPGRWWLADRDDRDGRGRAARRPRRMGRLQPALDRRAALRDRVLRADRLAVHRATTCPDEGLVRACLDSYRSLASTPDRLITGDDLLRRSQEHTDLLATHRRGRPPARACGSGSAEREQTRRTREGLLGDLLDEREQRRLPRWHQPGPPRSSPRSTRIWYVRGKVAFLFEVEWTAMLGEPLLRRHARIPPDESLIRFLVIAPERAELVRYKLERSPLLRAALDAGTWHIIKCEPPADVPGSRPARPRRPRAVSRARSDRRAHGGADAAVRRLERRRPSALG